MLFNPRTLRAFTWAMIMTGFTFGPCLAEDGDQEGYLSGHELFKIAEESEQTYTINDIEELEDIRLEEFAGVFWPSIGGSLEFPWIATQKDGRRSISEYDLEESCKALLLEAKPLYDENRYEEALRIYSKASKKYPRCYVAHSRVGDCHYFQGDLANALKWYNKAIKLNPYDFLRHYYKANTLFLLGRLDDARESYVMALALRPHRESIVKVLEMRAEALGVRFMDQPFAPRALARQEEDGVGIYIGADGAHWLTYGLCKGIWIGEPQHRIERNGNSEHSWTMQEERQCIKSMVETYLSLREDESTELDPEMERLYTIIESEFFDGFVAYEIAYRLYADMTLLFPQELFDEVVGYINLYVVADNLEAPGAQSADSSE